MSDRPVPETGKDCGHMADVLPDGRCSVCGKPNVPETGEREQETYRCPGCGHGHNLEAWAYGVMEGEVAADGKLATHDWVEDTELAESSLRCTIHGDEIAFEKYVRGAWCRWRQCEPCNGMGQTDIRYYRNQPCPACRGEGGAWVPAEEAACV